MAGGARAVPEQVLEGLTVGMRQTGIDVVGEAPWGTHFCQFYATKDDLADILVPYFKAGLEANEFCMWVTSPPLGVRDAWDALARAVPDLESYRRRGRIEILPHTEWYLLGGSFEQDRVLKGWVGKLEDALARGCAGLRLTGNTFWLEKSDWHSFAEYEAAVDGVLGQYRMLALCTYALDRCGASEVADVIRNHQFALIKRDGRWELFESFDRRRIQDALNMERERLAVTLESIGDAVIATDTHGRVIMLNRVAEDLTGWAHHEASGRSVGDVFRIVNERTGEPAEDPVRKVLELGARVRLANHTVLITRDGRRFPIADSAAPIRGRGGETLGTVLVFRDVTADRQMEQERDITIEFLRLLNETTGVRALIEAATAFFEKCAGCSAAIQVQGGDGAPGPGDAAREPEVSDSVASFPLRLAGERIGLLELRDPPRGQFTPACSALWERLAGYLAAALATARAQEDLRASETRNRLLFQNMLHGFTYCRMLFDERGRPDDFLYLDVNAAFETLTGLRDVVGKRVSEAIPGLREAQPELLEIYGRVARTGQAERFEIEIRQLGIWLSISVYSPHLDHFVAVFDNITDRKHGEESVRAANARLTEADQRKNEFLGMLSHELRNPLAPIRNSVYILDHAAPNSDQAARAKAVIKRQTEHLTRLVDDLLDVTRIARGKIELKPSRLDLALVARRVGDDQAAQMRQREIEFTVEIPGEPLWVDGDSIRLAQVIGNLLHNSAKFTGRGGRVTLALERIRGGAEIHVRDTGVGMEPELLKNVFDPFVQAERTLARTDGGLGLGLALVKGITELHGGSVRAASAGPGQGAELVVRLPLAEAGASEPAAPSRAVRAPRRRRVLVVDDNEDAAESLAQLVEIFGHAADVAYDGPSAIAKARASLPDVVFCDLGLPGMSGYDVVRALRSDETLRRVQVFAVSGYAQPEDRKRAEDAGFDGHVAKPSDPDVIERLLA